MNYKEEIEASRYLKNTSNPLKIKNLSRINILFGKNGTGKSSFVRKVFASNTSEFHLVVPERGGGNMIYHSNILDQENQENERRNVRSKNWDSQYRERAVSRTVAITQSVGYKTLKKQDQNLIDASDIESLFKVFLPEFIAKFSELQPHAIEFYRDIEGNETKIKDTSELSSGQAEALSLASDIITQAVLWKDEYKCVLIDEPDAHLHMDLQNRFAIFIEEISTKYNIQFVITTHSQALMAALMNVCESVSVVCLDDKSNEIKGIKKNNMFVFSNLLSSDLALAKILNRKIVLVEGNDDFLVWNQAARNQNFEDIALIESNGGDIYEYKKYAEAILSSVTESTNQMGITLCDRDDKNDSTHDINSLLPIKRLQCRSIENLFLTKEVLDSIQIDINLNDTLNSLKKKNEQENKLIDEILKNKKTAFVSKDLIKKIHSNIDKFADTTDWRIRVGKVLGKTRPSGELLEFLGDEIVNYIWGSLTEEAQPSEILP